MTLEYFKGIPIHVLGCKDPEGNGHFIDTSTNEYQKLICQHLNKDYKSCNDQAGDPCGALKIDEIK